MNPGEFLIAAASRFESECDRAGQANWIYRPRPDHWCMGDVAEHVTIANKLFVGSMRALQPREARPLDVMDEEIPYLFYRGDEPPHVGKPTGAWTEWASHKAEFKFSISKVMEESARVADPRQFVSPHPVFGLMDGVQWLLFAGAHIERHRAQLIGLMRAHA